MVGDNSQDSKYMSTAVLAKLELDLILQHPDAQTRFMLLTDFQNRTDKCVDDLVRENIPVSRALYKADARARAEIEKMYTDYGDIFDFLGIENPRKD